MKDIRVRIAPSPTGSLHLGTAHTALFNYLFARHHNGDFILRIDDSDKERSKKEFEANIIDSLKWLGIDWDEGPDVGGKYKYYRQSERGIIYEKYLKKLINSGNAYYCYCTSEELTHYRKLLEAKKIPPKYSGKCKTLTDKERIRLESQGKKGAIRIINPNKKVFFKDLIRGNITVDSSLFGDFIIARNDGSALLNFAATVDDIEMKISHAIRGEDFLNMVPRQLLIFEALKATPPEFAHLSFLYASDKTKLSKRHGATSVSEYKQMGYLPQALVNYLGNLGYTMSDGKEIFGIKELIIDFEFKRVQKSAPVFDLNKLDWYNGHYIRQMSNELLKVEIVNFYNNKLAEDLIEKTVPLIKERIKKLADYLPLCRFFFEEPSDYEMDLTSYKDLIKKMIVVLEELSSWQAGKIGQIMQKLAGKLKVKPSEFFMVLRVAVSGRKITPPLNESMEILGKEKVMHRIQKALS